MRGTELHLEPLPPGCTGHDAPLNVPQARLAGYPRCAGRWFLKRREIRPDCSGCCWLESPLTELVRRERERGLCALFPAECVPLHTHTHRGHSTSRQRTGFTPAPPAGRLQTCPTCAPSACVKQTLPFLRLIVSSAGSSPARLDYGE